MSNQVVSFLPITEISATSVTKQSVSRIKPPYV